MGGGEGEGGLLSINKEESIVVLLYYSLCTVVCIHMHARTYKHTHTHAHTHTHIHTYPDTHTYPHTHTHTRHVCTGKEPGGVP